MKELKVCMICDEDPPIAVSGRWYGTDVIPYNGDFYDFEQGVSLHPM